ncbi:MAG: SelB C-terminal domain-containing protein, partial [Candidatus Aminicenantes bacterium]|nr:SelB C-terminal domain-containing protein [Candidatus Aminicenantes bacterium]
MKNNPAGDADILLGLAREKGLKGVRESEAEERLPLDASGLAELAGKLEEKGQVRILSFAPLFIVSRESVDFLGQKILLYLTQFHQKNPKENGIPLDRLKKRFDAPAKILLLALMTLVHDGRLMQEGGEFALADFRRQLPPREEQLLRKLETTCFEGEFQALTTKEILERIPLTPQKLESLLDILIERKKVVAVPAGFYFPAAWLEGIIAKIRALSKRELSVAEFKTMTGLSRKFAIPMLELLDGMGVTRRDGSTRAIL